MTFQLMRTYSLGLTDEEFILGICRAWRSDLSDEIINDFIREHSLPDDVLSAMEVFQTDTDFLQNLCTLLDKTYPYETVQER